jgi:CubicO group peptidase (beta-lactamase class C family)
MPSAILFSFRHADPFRSPDPEENIGGSGHRVRSGSIFVTTDTSATAVSRYSVAMPSEAVASSKTASGTGLAPVRAVLEKAIRERTFPGAAYGVLHRNSIVALDAAGQFTYEASAPAVQPETVFDLASVTKVFATTAAAMLLVDRGIFDLDARLGDILPGFVIGMEHGSGKEKVTLRMLLAHTSGLPAYETLFRTSSLPDALLRATLQLRLEARPGTRTEYSDFGYILLGKVIEILSGEPLDAFCAREIFAPLGLAATHFCPAEENRSAIPPTENDQTFRGRVIQGEVQDENCFILGGVAGHAGLFANVKDILGFARCILSQGRTPDATALFQPGTVDQFATRQNSADSKSRALGWDVPTEGSSSGHYFGPRSIGHLGYSGCSLWIDPDQELAVALLTNRTWPDRSNQAIKQFRPVFHDAVVETLRRPLI